MTAALPVVAAGARAPSRLVRWAVWTVGLLSAAAALAVAVLALVLPAAAGGAARTVESASMAPALPVGSLVVEREVDPSRLRIGDIATYEQITGAHRGYVTHRVVGIDRAHHTFTFRGDANASADPDPVPARAIRGQVWFHVPYLGALRERVVRLRWLLIGLGVVGLGSYSVWQLAGGLREVRGAR